jgi:hypothetical protein
VKNDPARIETVGRIVSGENAGWFIYVHHDAADTGGYFIYRNPSRDFSGEPMFDIWQPDRDGLRAQFRYDAREIEWLPDPPPPEFR